MLKTKEMFEDRFEEVLTKVSEREIEFVKELPKTISGKIKRKELRAMEFERKRDVIEKLKEKGLWHR